MPALTDALMYLNLAVYFADLARFHSYEPANRHLEESALDSERVYREQAADAYAQHAADVLAGIASA